MSQKKEEKQAGIDESKKANTQKKNSVNPKKDDKKTSVPNQKEQDLIAAMPKLQIPEKCNNRRTRK